jgi:hypothetical protein
VRNDAQRGGCEREADGNVEEGVDDVIGRSLFCVVSIGEFVVCEGEYGYADGSNEDSLWREGS